MITIVYAHPLEDSLTASVRRTIEDRCEKSGAEYRVIDLYKDGFDPVLNAQEREGFFTGGTTQDSLVERYQELLRKTDRLVFVFPLWWNEQPAIVKGFVERVCLPGFAYEYTQRGLAPLLTNVKQVDVFTSSNSPTMAVTKFSGNIIQKQFIKNIILPMTGLKSANWENIGLAGASEEKLSEHLEKIGEQF